MLRNLHRHSSTVQHGQRLADRKFQNEFPHAADNLFNAYAYRAGRARTLKHRSFITRIIRYRFYGPDRISRRVQRALSYASPVTAVSCGPCLFATGVSSECNITPSALGSAADYASQKIAP